MSYQNLLNEPFDFDPAAAAAAASNGPAVTGNDGNRKMEQFRLAGPTEQQAMFANMSVDEWESAGDWFAEEFTSIMQKLREARRSKRNVIEGFEQEAATREEAVRQRSETLDRKLQKMRENGLRVVGDKKP
jgi:tRNA/tmRNA/rRNA uracil-C5-methylase (TrmA/RlmC/RlmD family)